MSKLVDKDRLARLAQSLDTRMKAAVKAEEDRAVAAEEGLQGQIDAMKNGDTGILAEAKKYADDQDAAQKVILDAEDKRLDQAIKDEAAAARAAEEALDGRVEVLETFKTQSESKHGVIEQDIADLKAADTAHEGRMDDIKDAADALEVRVKANEDKLVVVQGNGEGSIAKAQADAEAYADQLIEDLINGSKEGMDTLKELADAIEANKGVYDAYVEQHATAMSNMEKALKAEIDADVLVEKNRAEGKEAELLQAINDEVDDREAADTALAGRIAKNETFVAAQPAIDAEQDRRLGVLEGLINNEETGVQKQIDDLVADLAAHESAANTKNGTQDAAIQQAQADANKANTAIGNAESGLVKDINDLKAVDAALDGRIEVLETFKEDHSHTAMEQGIADNKAAIDVLNGNAETAGSVAKSIADALDPYSTTAEVKQILTNVVATLNLSIVDDQVVLKLGGAEGVTLSQTTLDMATDADIDAIITGLDAE